MSRKKASAAILSIVSNSSLVALKIVVGLAMGSVAILSEAVHSGIDLLASFIALFAVKTSHLPADDEHPFGHGKIENLSGTLEAILIFAAAGWIIFEASKKLIHPEPLENLGWGVLVMLFSATVNFFVSNRLFSVGRETGSVALEADGWHLRTDVYTSAGVTVGLSVIWAGEKLLPGIHLHWIDPVVAILVALLILKAAWNLTREAGRDLMDASLPHEEEKWLREYISRLSPTIRGYHGLRTRKSGSRRFIEFHLLVESEMSVRDSHRITDVMVCDIEEHLPGSSVTIHVEPCEGECSPKCLAGCLLSESEREAQRASRKNNS